MSNLLTSLKNYCETQYADSPEKRTQLEAQIKAYKASQIKEFWQYTNFDALLKQLTSFTAHVPENQNPPQQIQAQGSLKLTLKDACPTTLIQHHSLKTTWVPKSALAEKVSKHPTHPINFLESINDLMADHCLVIECLKDADIQLNLEHIITQSNAHHLTILLLLNENAKLTLIEDFPFGQGAFYNLFQQVHLSKKAQLTHIIQQNPSKTIKQHSIKATLDSQARYDTYILHHQEEFTRYDIDKTLLGTKASAHIASSVLMKSQGNLHQCFNIHHQADKTEANILSHQLVRDQALVSFEGSIYMQENCQSISASQYSASILMDQGRVYAKPALNILTDSVTCSHGISIGSLDKESLFYLMSRGIPLEKAQVLILHSFLQAPFHSLSEANHEYADRWIKSALQHLSP